MQGTESLYFEELIGQMREEVCRKLFTEVVKTENASKILINEGTVYAWCTHTMEYCVVIKSHAIDLYLL